MFGSFFAVPQRRNWKLALKTPTLQSSSGSSNSIGAPDPFGPIDQPTTPLCQPGMSQDANAKSSSRTEWSRMSVIRTRTPF
jgi:hypothetical protein